MLDASQTSPRGALENVVRVLTSKHDVFLKRSSRVKRFFHGSTVSVPCEGLIRFRASLEFVGVHSPQLSAPQVLRGLGSSDPVQPRSSAI